MSSTLPSRAELLRRLVAHSAPLPDEYRTPIERAYRDARREFGELIAGDIYERLQDAADEGRNELYLLALLAALAAAYRAQQAARRAALEVAALPGYVYAFEHGAHEQLEAWGVDELFSLRDPATLAILTASLATLAGIAVSTHDRTLLEQTVRSAVTNLPAPTLDTQHLADGTADVVQHRAGNEGRLTVAQRSVTGIVYKTWRHTPGGPKEQRRPSHAALEGVKIRRNELFDMGGTMVKHPHDWDRAGAANWLRCHCVCVYEPEDEDSITPWLGD